MKERDESEERLMKYLLGDISEAQREAIEQQLLADDDFEEQISRLESELADDYVQGKLSDNEKQRFEDHFLRSEEGREQTAFAAMMMEYANKAAQREPEPSSIIPANATGESAEKSTTAKPASSKVVQLSIFRRAWANPYLRMAASLIIVAGLGLLAYRLFIYHSDVDKGLAALKQAYKGERPTEARIGGFDYAPYIVTRGANDKAGNTTEKERAELILLNAVHDNPGAASHHALGRFYLADKRFDKAIEQFDKALKFNDKDAQTHADKGAALLEQGKTLFDKPGGKAVEAFAKSVEHLSQALELNDGLLEARFNYALALQQLGLPQRAREEWQKYLEKDSQSKWADEAREKLKALEEQIKQTSLTKEEVLAQFLAAYQSGNDNQAWEIICRNRDPISGRFITEQLLDLYIAHKLTSNDKAAEENFNALAYASNLEKRRSDERYPESLVEYYKSQSLENLQRLQEAREFVKYGQLLNQQGDYRNAAAVYSKASVHFQSVGAGSENLAAQFWIALNRMEAAEAQGNMTSIETLALECEKNHYKWLQMRSILLLSSGLFILRKSSDSIKNKYLSLEIARQLEDKTAIFHIWTSIIKFYETINNYPRSLAGIQDNLREFTALKLPPLYQYRHYSFTASIFAALKYARLAIIFQQETLKMASVLPRKELSIAYAHLAGFYLKINRNSEAQENARLAYETANLVADEKIRYWIVAYVSMYVGNVCRESQDLDNAIINYTRTIETFEKLHLPIYLYQAHKGRLFCYLAQGNYPVAEDELSATLQLLEDNRFQITEANNRNNFFDVEQTIYDLAINYESLKGNNFNKAFEYAEMARARSLLDLVQSQSQIMTHQGEPDIQLRNSFVPLPLETIQARMPEEAQLLHYAVLEDRLLISVLSKSQFSNVLVSISQERLEEKIKTYVKTLSQPPEDGAAIDPSMATALFDILLEPVESLLKQEYLLYIIPDKALNTLPFGALRSSRTNRYLIQDYVIAYAPSASLFVMCSEKAKQRESLNHPESILGVGNPLFDRAEFAELSALTSAEQEVRQVSAFYDAKSILTGATAKESKVRSAMGSAEIIHLATHSILDENSALKSKILLSKEANQSKEKSEFDGVLEAQELYQTKMPRARLAILSSCQSAIDRYYKGEGAISLIRPFLVAGVPLVIAGLWQVDSAATAELMIHFHQYRKRQNRSSVQALRLSQVEMITGADQRFVHPYYWAAFIPAGGYTSF